MKKRLLKAMPHVPILELRPELREQHNAVDDNELNPHGIDDANGAEMEANTTFHDLEAKPTGGYNGLVQMIKRFISKKKANGGNIRVGKTGPLMITCDMVMINLLV